MSYKILIIDDEELICKSIKSMLRRANLPEISEIKYTCSSSDGLELIKHSVFDIVITDIRMPDMDGLTMIESTISLKKRPRFIILSGYEDFQYARNALKLKVIDYLLKPVRKSDLEGAVLAAIQAIENDKKSLFIDNGEFSNGTVALDHIIRIILRQKKDSQESLSKEYQMLSSFMTKEFFFVCIFMTYGERFQSGNRTDDDYLNLLSEKFAVMNDASVYRHIDQNNYDVFIFNSTRDHYIEVSQHITRVLKNMPNYDTMKLIASISDVSNQIDKLPELYRQAVDSMSYRILYSGNTLIKYRDVRMKQAKFELDYQYVNAFIEDLANIKFDRIMGFIDRTFNLEVLNGYTLDAIERLYKGIINIIMISAKEFYTEEIFESMIRHNNFYSFDSMRDMRLYLKNLIHKLFYGKRTKPNPISPIDIAKKYVKENLDKDIDMTVISNIADVSYVYFSQIFKQDTGMNFSDYLLTQRMAEAQKLLNDPSYKIHEIAERLGYQNPKNFSRAFKKYYGLSPKDYQNGLKNN